MDKEELTKIIKDAVGPAVAEELEAQRQKSIERANTAGIADSDPTPTPQKEEPDLEPGMKMARMLRYLYQGGGTIKGAIEHAEKLGEEWFAKALGESTLEGGGAWVPEGFSEEIIGLLSAKTVVRAAGVSTVDMPNGTLRMPFVATGSTASYIGEGDNIPKSEPTGGQLQLANKKLSALIPVSNDLLRSSQDKSDRLIRDDIVRAMSLKEDVTFLRSDGSGGEPKGMLYWAPAANKFNANATVSVPNVTDDLGQAVFLLEDGDVPTDALVWFFSPRTKKYLMTARDGNNNLVWAEEMRGGTLMGIPWKMTSQIPNNLGGATNESEVYLANTELLVIAEQQGMMIEMFDNATYYDGSALRSGVSRDESVVRAIALHDFGARQRGQEIVVIEAVKWGA